MKQALILAITLTLLAGCQQSQQAHENKRDQDRMAMQLADAQRDRDTEKNQIDKLQADLTKVAAAATAIAI